MTAIAKAPHPVSSPPPPVHYAHVYASIQARTGRVRSEEGHNPPRRGIKRPWPRTLAGPAAPDVPARRHRLPHGASRQSGRRRALGDTARRHGSLAARYARDASASRWCHEAVTVALRRRDLMSWPIAHRLEIMESESRPRTTAWWTHRVRKEELHYHRVSIVRAATDLVTGHGSRVMSHGSQVVDHGSQITDTDHKS